MGIVKSVDLAGQNKDRNYAIKSYWIWNYNLNINI